MQKDSIEEIKIGDLPLESLHVDQSTSNGNRLNQESESESESESSPSGLTENDINADTQGMPENGTTPIQQNPTDHCTTPHRIRAHPGVYRIPGRQRGEISQAPRARAVVESTLPQAYPVEDDTDALDSCIDRRIHEAVQVSVVTEKNVLCKIAMLKKHSFVVAFIIFIILNTVLIIMKFSGKGITDTTDTSVRNETVSLEESASNNSDTHLYEISENSTSQNISEPTSVPVRLDVSKTCFTDPMVIYILEKIVYDAKEDLKKTRTYHICANTTMNIFDFDLLQESFDFSSGDVHPFILFLPNIHIKCGYDGDVKNNCTFVGGTNQVVLSYGHLESSEPTDTTTENITIEGFSFTGAKAGNNILVRSSNSSLTVKNCIFYENDEMVSNINVAMNQTMESTTHVQYCTFSRNTYSKTVKFHNGEWLIEPLIGSIVSLPQSNSFIETSIIGSAFTNNTFLIEPGDTDIIAGGVINLFPPATLLEISNSCFVENKGYSSALILVGREKINSGKLENYYGNSFYGNFPSESYGSSSSCVVSYLNGAVSYRPLSFVVEEDDCIDYDVVEGDNSSSALCM